MDYKKRYNDALSKARYYHSKDYMLINTAIENIFPELAESEDERIRKELIEQIAFIPPSQDELNSELDTLPCYNERIERYRSWLEKQGQTFTKKDVDDAYLKGILDAKHEIEKQGKTLDPVKVIAWLVANIIDFEYYVKLFKKDFGL